MIDGNTGQNILSAAAETFPTLKPAELLDAAAAHFTQTSSAEPELVHGWCLEATRELYRRMLEIGDYPNALRAVKQMRDLTK